MSGSAIHETPLYRFLVDNFPDYRWKRDRIDVPALATALKMTNEGVYKWLRASKISLAGAARLLELKPTLDKKELINFLIVEPEVLPLLNL